MAWVEIQPVQTIIKSSNEVTLKVRKPTKRAAEAALIVTINPTRIKDGLAFWRRGARVAALIGVDDDAGRLRFTAGDDFGLTSLGNKVSVSLILPLPTGLRQDDFRRIGATISDYSDTWIEIEVPKSLREGKGGGNGAAMNVDAMAIVNGGAGASGGNGTTKFVDHSRRSGKTEAFRTSATGPDAPRPAAGGR